MKFDVFGKKENPVIVMLTGSFFPGEGLEYLYSKLSKEFYIIVPTYNGVYKDSTNFTTRQNEAKEIVDYIIKKNIYVFRMIYGQSMGSEIGAELTKQLIDKGVKIERIFFDGAPMIRLSKAYKAFMYFKFKSMINLLKDKDVDEAIHMPFLKPFAGNKIESLKPMMKSLAMVAPYITKQTIKNQVECCYTFDFPHMSEDMQKQMYFCYGTDEKAYKTCIKGVTQAYPNANYIIKEGHGHMSYSVENTDEYIELLKSICK